MTQLYIKQIPTGHKRFDGETEKDIDYLHGVIEALMEKNASDAEIVIRLQEIYETQCWFSVISFAEQVIYG